MSPSGMSGVALVLARCADCVCSVWVADQSLLTTFPQRSYVQKCHRQHKCLCLRLPPALVPERSVRVLGRSPGCSRSGKSKSSCPGVPSEGLGSALRSVDQKGLWGKASGDGWCRAGEDWSNHLRRAMSFHLRSGASHSGKSPSADPLSARAGRLCQLQPSSAASSGGHRVGESPALCWQRDLLVSSQPAQEKGSGFSCRAHRRLRGARCASCSLSSWQMQASRNRHPGPKGWGIRMGAEQCCRLPPSQPLQPPAGH